MSMTPTALKDLRVGDIIFTDVIINKADMADPNATSGTAKKIKSGKPVTRLAIVLVAGTTSVQVTYLATFNNSTTLPTRFADKTMWYPIQPAIKESIYNPLPPLPNNRAQWACLRVKQTITQNPVQKTAEVISAASAQLILNAMKA